jgi:hypothetical protein
MFSTFCFVVEFEDGLKIEYYVVDNEYTTPKKSYRMFIKYTNNTKDSLSLFTTPRFVDKNGFISNS